MSFESSLHQLATQFGQPGLLDAPHVLTLQAIPITLAPDAADTGCVATVEIGRINPSNTALLEAMLGANLFGDGHGTSVLGMRTTGEVRVTLHCSPIPAEPAELGAALLRLAEHAGRWRKRVAPPHAAPAAQLNPPSVAARAAQTA